VQSTSKKGPHGISQFAPTIRPERTQQLTPKATGLSDQLQRTGDSPPQPSSNQKGVKYLPPTKHNNAQPVDFLALPPMGTAHHTLFIYYPAL
jgi:hypothetical protein